MSNCGQIGYTIKSRIIWNGSWEYQNMENGRVIGCRDIAAAIMMLAYKLILLFPIKICSRYTRVANHPFS